MLVSLFLAPFAGASTSRVIRATDLARQATWTCQAELGQQHSATRYSERRSPSVAYRRWVLRLWEHRARDSCGLRDRLNALPPRAIVYVFRGYASQALRVASGESGSGDIWRHPYCTHAANGQYLGCFQMGSGERARYARLGYATALQQAWAAYWYFCASGRDWSPWQVKPF